MPAAEQQTFSQPKSQAARQAALMVLMDNERTPFGTKPGENLRVAANYVPAPAVVYVVNHSRTRAWKRISVPVSTRHGGEEALRKDAKLREIYNVDMLYHAVANGQDMNRYEEGIKPVVFTFMVGGQLQIIPPAKNADQPPPRIEVPEGSLDLFLGNYDRMRGIVRDENGQIKSEGSAAIIGDERSRLAVMWRRRKNPVFMFTDDADTKHIDNEFGFLEFVRETKRPAIDAMDKEFLTALDLVEAV
jgi:hypothetical protein